MVVIKVHSTSTELVEHARPNSIYTGHDRNPSHMEPDGNGYLSKNKSEDPDKGIPPIYSHST